MDVTIPSVESGSLDRRILGYKSCFISVGGMGPFEASLPTRTENTAANPTFYPK
jgi:hypothetical protein